LPLYPPGSVIGHCDRGCMHNEQRVFPFFVSDPSMGQVFTLLGRQRLLPDAMQTADKLARAHALRAAINTPIQGGAADIAMLAMLQLRRSQELKRLGYKLLMQARLARVGVWGHRWLGRTTYKGGGCPAVATGA